MIKIIYLFLIIIFSTNNSNAAEKKNCSGIKKLSKDYIACKSNNLKSGIGSKISKTGIGDKLSKTGNPFKGVIDYQKKAWKKK